MDTAANTPTSAPDAPGTPAARRVTACRVCGDTRLFPYLHLGMQPLANAHRAPADTTPESRFPLTVRACPTCRLSQLTHVVDPDILYAHGYVFYAGASKAWRTHCGRLAEATQCAPGAFVVDIASNDGTLLHEFSARGARILGVDPAPNFADGSYPLRTAYWTAALAREPEFAGCVDVLCATNVLGHVDDVHDFMAGVATALAPSGRAIIEVPYVADMLDWLTYDLVYHEHLSYWSVTALNTLAKAHDLKLVDVQRLHVHGGSLRVTLARSGAPSAALTRLLVAEHHDLRRAVYMRFSERVSGRMAELNVWLKGLAPYTGFGASAKATVLLNTLNVEAFPARIVDDALAKQGKLVPGTKVPVMPPPTDWRTEPGPVVVFTWNQTDAVTRHLRRAGYTGMVCAPFPAPHVVPA